MSSVKLISVSSVEDKLHWTFKLYDQDGSGEIDPDEMELIFTKLCKEGFQNFEKKISWNE